VIPGDPILSDDGIASRDACRASTRLEALVRDSARR